MLEIILDEIEFYDESTEGFKSTPPKTLCLQHSLLSLSKWESKYEKPFLSAEAKTDEEVLYYIYCMCLTEITPEDLSRIKDKHIIQINEFIESKQTATWFGASESKASREVITSELIYYWMTALNIPFSCEEWHLNRLFTLIRVCSEKQQKPKKIARADAAAQQRALNEKRKAQLNTQG